MQNHKSLVRRVLRTKWLQVSFLQGGQDADNVGNKKQILKQILKVQNIEFIILASFQKFNCLSELFRSLTAFHARLKKVIFLPCKNRQRNIKTHTYKS